MALFDMAWQNPLQNQSMPNYSAMMGSGNNQTGIPTLGSNNLNAGSSGLLLSKTPRIQ
jgi:hypothetical protein